LQRKGDISQNSPTIAAWSIICKSKDKGGLGVIDLKMQHECVLLKFLDKCFNKKYLPWVHLIWATYYANALPPAKTEGLFFCAKIASKFHKNTRRLSCNMDDGNSIMIWKDKWNDQSLYHSLPHLASFTKSLEISAHKASITIPLSNLLHLPLTEIAHEEFHTFSNLE
jgi:hypothetical protein